MNLLQRQLAWLRGANAKKVETQQLVGMPTGAALVGGNLRAFAATGILGDTDIYTVPAGMVAQPIAWYRRNPTGGAITVTGQIVNGAIPRRFNFPAVSVSAGAVNNQSGLATSFMLAGETLRSTETAAGLTHHFSVVEAPAGRNSFIRLAVLPDLTIAAQKLYEAPADKTGFPGTNTAGGAVIICHNDSGTGAKTVTVYLVPPSQSPAADHIIGTASPADAGAAANVNFVPAVPPGWSLWATSSSNDPGVMCRVLMSEYDV